MFGKNKKKKDFEKVNLSYQQLFYTNALSIEAIVNMLEKNGLLKKEDVLEEIKRLGKERKQKMEAIDENIKKSN